MSKADCAYYPLSQATNRIGFIVYHATAPQYVKSIKKEGLGDPVQNWMWGGGSEHHTWYLYCALNAENQAPLHDRFGTPPFSRIPVEWDKAVLEAFRAQHSDAYMTWVAEEINDALTFGSKVFEIRVENIEGIPGFMFPDHAYGWALITFGKRIPPEDLYLLTKRQMES